MLQGRTFCLVIFLCASLTGIRPAFAQIQPRPDLHPRDGMTPSEQNRLIGFDAMAHELGAELVKAGKRKVIVVDFRGPDKYWSPFADWLADQFSLALKTATSSLRVVDRAKLEELEPIEVDESSVCASTIRAALELGVDTIVEGTYRPAENGVGVSLNAHPVIGPGNGGCVWTSPISTVGGKIPFTSEVGSTVYLPLDALWPANKKFTSGEQGVGYPSCIYCPNPQYSSEAHKARLEGTVVLLAVINADGRATQIRIAKSLGSGLDEKAIEALKEWKFKPATDADGRSVPVFTPIELVFRLN
jgi:TonB family protein